MVELAVAFATAQAAVAGIKKAVALGKDIQGLIGDFQKFFDCKDVVVKAANDNAKRGRSDTSQALEIVMQQHALLEAERELKELLIYNGYPQLWEQLLIERNRIQQERRAQDLAAKAARKKRAADIANATFLISVVTATIVVMGCVLYFIAIVAHF